MTVVKLTLVRFISEFVLSKYTMCGNFSENICKPDFCDYFCTIKELECFVDHYISHKPTDTEYESFHDNQLCKSGTCLVLTGCTNCEINGKCISSKKLCIFNECKGVSEESCVKNNLCLLIITMIVYLICVVRVVI
jgi:hypothetical protein